MKGEILMDLIFVLIFLLGIAALISYVLRVPVFLVYIFVSWLLFKIRLIKLKKLMIGISDKSSVSIETARKILNLIDDTRVHQYLYYEKHFDPVRLRYTIIKGLESKKEFIDLSLDFLSMPETLF
jgi:hypothetical protein